MKQMQGFAPPFAVHRSLFIYPELVGGLITSS